MKEYIDRNEFLKRIKPYDTSDKTDKALYNFALNKMIGTPTADVIPIPEGATNGDMIKSLFPNGTESIGRKKIYYSFYPNGDMEFNIAWWNAPFKKGREE